MTETERVRQTDRGRQTERETDRERHTLLRQLLPPQTSFRLEALNDRLLGMHCGLQADVLLQWTHTHTHTQCKHTMHTHTFTYRV